MAWILVWTIAAHAADWNVAEQQLARKVVTVTGPGAVALTVQNRSSLARRDSEAVQNGLRSALEGLGVRFVGTDQAAATVAISLSENSTSYVWVAEIHQGAGENAVVMVALPRPEGAVTPHESVPLSLRKTFLWSQDDPILDVAVLEENGTPTRIAVLDANKVGLYRWQAGKWQAEQTLGIVHARPWPRDLRGRLMVAKDHLLDVYLPGETCRASTGVPLTLNCRENDDPWPLVSAGLSGTPAMGAFYAPTRNFFTGVLSPGVGRFKTVAKFYSAAVLPREKYLLWMFAATDGRIHLIDGMSDQPMTANWGSDIASVKTACGAGWQVLASTYDEETGDSLRAYEFPDRDPVAVSAAVDFSGWGLITALWTEPNGETAVAVLRNRETGNYEAFRLAVACNP
ncbi:MAG TPA: hypothetical protein VGM18_08695 [Candidatus Sulfotelmatobacter sp.]